MIKIFIDRPTCSGKEELISGENAHHLKVLRVHPEETILLGVPGKKEFYASIVRFSKEGVYLSVKEPTSEVREPLREVALFAALPKNNKYEDIVFRCSQLGVSEFYPILTSRTEKKVKSSEQFYRRCKMKARHGSEISGRSSVPQIKEIISYSSALKLFKESDYNSAILFWEEEESSKNISFKDLSEKMAIFIGPEGGWSTEEIKEAMRAGLKIRSLGPLIMDVETACISANALLLI